MSTIFLIYLTSVWLLTPLAPAQTSFIDNGQVTIPFAKGKRFKLEGNWEFYSEQLLTPETVNGATGRTWMHVPHAWKKYKILFGTYRLRFQAQPPLEEMALHLDIIATAHRVWINGREYPGRGQVSSDLKDHRGEIGTRLLVFSPRENNEILIQVSSNTTFGGIINTPALSSAHPIIAEQVLIAVFQGLLQGILLMIAMYHSLLYLMRKRDRSHLFLAMGCLGIFLRDSTVGHVIVLQEVFRSIPIALHFKVQYTGAMLTTLGYFLFTHYLFPQAMRPWLLRSVVGLEISALVLAYALPVDQRDYAALIHVLGSLLALVFGIIGVYRMVRQKEPYSLVFFCGITIFCSFCLMDLFLVTNWNSPMLSLASIATCIFSFFQAALLAQRNAKAHRDLEREQRKNFHAYEELSKLVYPHQLALLKNGEILENTMPVGQAEGIVLQFDIIDSSRLESAVAKAFFEKIFTRTNEVIMRDYDPERLIASGFRIKELGDGFLCSVGFPFASPQGVSQPWLALQLAEEFVRIFQEEEAWLDHNVYGRLHCAIGIAMGEVSGYFPQAGIKNYDLFGSGIILATRYESIRKHLFASMDPIAIIIVQNRVFEGLPEPVRRDKAQHYHIHDIEASDFRVRNDPEATYFYYCTIDSLESQQQASA